MLRAQRKTESRIVNGFAYSGLIIAVLAGLALVLGIPYLRGNLIAATIAYVIILLVGGRVLAGVLGGYYGDRIGFERAPLEATRALGRVGRRAGRGLI